MPMIITADAEDIKQRLNELNIEHRDLDDVISQLSRSTAQDQLQLQRLKKRKLHLKDQISTLERQLTPDISA
ncbi:MAG: YdcH family protein [Burkholderiales bacterium]|nr:YdcH family protein [Burkholderiales bacterium]